MFILVHDLEENICTYQDAITASGSYLLTQNYIHADYINACIDREKNYPTGLMMSNDICIAIPHANYQLVKSDAISLVRSTKGIEFSQMDDANLKIKCQLIYNLALSTSDQHLSILRKLFVLFQDENFVTSCQKLSCNQVKQLMNKQLNN